MSRRRTSGLSRKANVQYGIRGTLSGTQKKSVLINKTSGQLAAAKKFYEEQLQSLSYTQREEILGSGQDCEDIEMEDPTRDGLTGDWEDEDEVLYHTLPPGEEGSLHSHAGAESIWHSVVEGMRPGRGDPRVRSHCVQDMLNAWTRHMPHLVKAMLTWKEGKETVNTEGGWPLRVLGFDESRVCHFSHADGAFGSNEALILRGYIGASPEQPTIAFSLRTFEIYRQIHRVTPRFTIDSLARALDHLHSVPCKRYLQEQLTSAYDAYLEIMRRIDTSVSEALGRDSGWEAQNVCAPCFYRVDGEPGLKFSLFISVDGNNSLKLVDSTFRSGNPRFDSRQSSSWRWLTPAQVDVFKDEVKNSARTHSLFMTVLTGFQQAKKPGTTTAPPVQNDSSDHDTHSDSLPTANEDVAWLNVNELNGSDIQELEKNISVCVERWKAAGPEARKKMFALFAISGIFLAVCRHGHVLIMCDMIRSGELMKYPLALVKHILDTYGADIGLGYDIMCAFFKTLLRSSFGKQVIAMRMRGIVPAFHGHAHNRECQLGWHPMYAEGVGLEDFEECERTFCQSNQLASCTRLATPFHRQQQIDEHFAFHNLDKYASTGSFIFSNYRQAVERITANTVQLEALESKLRTTAADYEADIKAELQHLQDLKEEPSSVTQAVDYLELLGKLQSAQDASKAAEADFHALDQLIIQRGITGPKITQIRTRYRTTHTRLLLVEDEVARFEVERGIEHRWDQNSPEYREALVTLSERRYCRALDKLERLVVQRLMELTKLSMSGVGYKLRDKVGRALHTRADAIHRALIEYNQAASLLNPPRESLQWTQVVQTATLAEFDLLRNTRVDIRELPWTIPARREAAALYFGIQRAQEEIQRLNVEIRRLVTFMIDDHADFHRAISAHKLTNPALAEELSRRLAHKSQVNAAIVERLIKTSLLPGFSGSLLPGDRVGRDPALNHDCPLPHWASKTLGLRQVEVEISEDNDAMEVPRELQGLDEDSVVDLMDCLHVSVLDDDV